MVQTCSVYNCTQRYKKGIKFHRFPTNEVLKRKWIAAIAAMRRYKYTPSKYAAICGNHFKKSDYSLNPYGNVVLNKDAVPSIFKFGFGDTPSTSKRLNYNETPKERHTELSTMEQCKQEQEPKKIKKRKKRCRVCLEKASKLYPIYGEILNCDQEIGTMIKYCTSIEVDICEDLPNGVCVQCFKTLRIAYNFIVQFKENHEKLLQEREETCVQTESGKLIKEDMLCDIIPNPGGSQINYLIQESEDLDELVEDEEEPEQVQEHNQVQMQEQELDEEEYEYQEVKVENLGEFLKSLEENSDTTNLESFQQNVTVQVIKADPPPEDENPNKPQTVLRRKIKIRFSCPVCPSLYFASFENGLLPHMSLHKESFQCNVCIDGTLYNSDLFLVHFMKHHRYQCPYCGKSFNRTGTLTAHIKTHSSFRYYCSAEGCTKSFPTSWTLKKHEGVHSNHAAYLCNECNLEFKTYDTYMYHQKKHTGKKFLCICCGRTFMQSVHLKYHMQQHTGIKQFKCDVCDKSYTSSSQLKKHKKRHHEPARIWVENVDVDFSNQDLEDVIQG